MVLCDAMRDNAVLFAAVLDLKSLMLSESLEPGLAEMPRESDGWRSVSPNLHSDFPEMIIGPAGYFFAGMAIPKAKRRDFKYR